MATVLKKRGKLKQETAEVKVKKEKKTPPPPDYHCKSAYLQINI